MKKKEFSTEIGGKTLTAVFSDLADQAHGSVVLTYGKTSVLATAVMSESEREGIDFFPLVVDYEEKFYAAGEILGSRFIRREGRPSDEAILSGRVVDRTIRPLFDQHVRNEVQVVITVLAIDEDDPDVLAVNAASLALATSDIPFRGPVSAVRISKVKDDSSATLPTGGALVVNPSYAARGEANLLADSVVCGKDGNITMIEIGAHGLKEEDAEALLLKASEEIEKIQKFQKQIIGQIGKEKRAVAAKAEPAALKALFEEHIAAELSETVFGEKDGVKGKKNTRELERRWETIVKEHAGDEARHAGGFFHEKIDELIHKEALQNGRRADDRGMDEIRPLFAQAGGISSILHGTGVFYRGGTHVLSVLTLGGPKDAQLIEGMEVQTTKRFMHHYNFPPFSTGETGRIGGMNRRMTGHGALAEKALLAVIPPKEDFPYTIRIVSESLASNGSTSMASVCAGTLALMDAGVPIKAPVAGIAMGLIMSPDGNEYKILTDIQGPEDHHGDMDFKVAGTREGITAVQMDVKVEGVPVKILGEAFLKAESARQKILDTIEHEIAAPRPEPSPAAPKIITIKIATDKIGLLIGPGGKTINGIIKETGAEIDIEEDGTVFLLGKDGSAEKALAKVEEIMHEYVAGEQRDGVVTRLFDFGAMVKIGPTTEGLVHISEFAPVRILKISDLVKEGDLVPVVVKEIDEKGRVNLSIKQRDPEFFKEKLEKLSHGTTQSHTNSSHPARDSSRYGEPPRRDPSGPLWRSGERRSPRRDRRDA